MAKRRIGPQKGPQTEFLKSSADIVIYGGSAGGGKSYGILLDHARRVKVPGYKGAIFRTTMQDITNPGGMWDDSQNIYPDLGGIPVTYRHYWKFPTEDKKNPALVRMMGLEHEKKLENFKGAQIPVISFDELSGFSERMFWYMLSRNRSAVMPFKPYTRATTNPWPDSWLSELIDWWIGDDGFIIPERSGMVRYLLRIENETHWGDDPRELEKLHGKREGSAKSFTFIRSTIFDNKILMKDDPTYLSNLENQSKADRAALLDGNWKYRVNVGMYFQREWVREVETIDEPLSNVVQYWDRANTEPSPEYRNPDYTAGVTMGVGANSGAYYILNVRRFRKRTAEGRILIQKAIEEDISYFSRVKPRIERDAGAAGKDSAQDLAKFLGKYDVRIRSTNNKSKLDRFQPFSAAAENGNVIALKAPWNSVYYSELENFTGLPGSNKDDQVDATSGAYNELANLVEEDCSGITLTSGLSSPSKFRRKW